MEPENPPTPSNPTSIWDMMLYFTVSSSIALFGMVMGYNKKWLPKWLASKFGRLFFWPSILITWIDTYYIHSKKRSWYSIFEAEGIILGAAPLHVSNFINHPKMLQDDFNVQAVINLCDEYDGPTKTYQDLRILHLHLPTLDHYEPSMNSVNSAMKFLDSQLGKFVQNPRNEENKKVYIHCRAGHGRSAMIAFCWILRCKFLELINHPVYNQRGERIIPTHFLEEIQNKMNEKRWVRKHLFRQRGVLEYFEFLKSEYGWQ